MPTQKGNYGAGPGDCAAYGPNNEQLQERLEGALRRLAHQFSPDSESTQLPHVRPTMYYRARSTFPLE